MGNPRKPTALKLVDGNPGHRPIAKNEPKPVLIDRASCPHRLKGRLRDAWNEVAPVAFAMKIVTDADLVALESLAVALGRVWIAEESLEKPVIFRWVDDDGVKQEMQICGAGEVTYVANGIQRSRAEIGQIQAGLAQVRALLGLFGMTPADRSRTATIKRDDDRPDGFSQF